MKSALKLSLMLSLTAGLAAPVLTPTLAQAQNRYDVRDYDGYCYVRQKDAKREGAVIGAVAGGIIGGSVANTRNKGLGTVLGAVIGSAVGSNAGRSSVKCYNDEYYSYQGHYYDPPSAPSGYVPVFYRERPSERYYKHVYYDRDHHGSPPPYGYGNAWNNGWRDNHGRWHDGQPPRGHRQDRNGNWDHR